MYGNHRKPKSLLGFKICTKMGPRIDGGDEKVIGGRSYHVYQRHRVWAMEKMLVTMLLRWWWQGKMVLDELESLLFSRWWGGSTKLYALGDFRDRRLRERRSGSEIRCMAVEKVSTVPKYFGALSQPENLFPSLGDGRDIRVDVHMSRRKTHFEYPLPARVPTLRPSSMRTKTNGAGCIDCTVCASVVLRQQYEELVHGYILPVTASQFTSKFRVTSILCFLTLVTRLDVSRHRYNSIVVVGEHPVILMTREYEAEMLTSTEALFQTRLPQPPPTNHRALELVHT
ncbi:uncharacterized protein EV420DRAFT_1474839 [Desarmillaria tabescens]|uniref:Uncharacterized protein n=1 Tax=Armillaria tabescens TaxID=1929756 RepID=A0AA39NI15_ARMTA|nr:uncharacterized protein EV420DRAFT_1474839 [Desarmillaria tabescens]KAK0466026.1 hypothetical protein EV420DRAFT_1474839 [Desarmillaria tabescens]